MLKILTLQLNPSLGLEDSFQIKDEVLSEVSLSVVIIALNEEKSLGRCLKGLPKGAEIIVLDSGSSDRTLDIAKEHGAAVYFRAFDDYAAQKNAAISYASGKWILSLDADEVIDQRLRSAMELILRTENPPYAAYKIKRSLVYMGKKLRFGKVRDYPIRFFQKGKAKFLGEIHEKLDVDGRIDLLDGEISHYSYDNLDDYFHRFNVYTKKNCSKPFCKEKECKSSYPLHETFS